MSGLNEDDLNSGPDENELNEIRRWRMQRNKSDYKINRSEWDDNVTQEDREAFRREKYGNSQYKDPMNW